MSYQVLARKWRPRSFEQMVGQTHVLRALINALNQGRVHHAYLFTGTRGVGKTTLGRVLAKCLNCEVGVSARPCCQCGTCQDIDAGRFIDLIEVDAASRTKVEDTRELLDNIQYAPTYGRYKVYLIDEVHMLSGHSFNALLKTLEEPPPHVKFILATTDPQKLPMTVLSRCLQFNLKRISVQQISAHLRHILDEEGIPAEAAALTQLAWAADGSMRDALSLVDQAVGFGGDAVREAAVREMLGAAPRELMRKLALAVASSDATIVLQAVADLAEHLTDFAGVLAELISLLHQVALAQAVPAAVDDNHPLASLARELSRRLSPQDVQLYYQIALIGRRDLPLAADSRAGLEMTLLRMLSFKPLPRAQSEEGADLPDALHNIAGESQPHKAKIRPQSGAVESADAQQRDYAQAPSTACSQGWPRLMQNLKLKGVAYALASNCSVKSLSTDEVCLVLDAKHAEIKTGNAEARLKRALSDHLGRAVRLRIEIAEHLDETPAQLASRNLAERQRAAETAIETDATVQAFKERFDAEIIPGSIRPISD
ncbi:MAG TPA: DNA polymerase III subunit gamma/tau [Gammaproteobacteria bacterium]|nr:DNA polymerase III subunit gamma/tau [Gammaproteobacteria bacterium]